MKLDKLRNIKMREEALGIRRGFPVFLLKDENGYVFDIFMSEYNARQRLAQLEEYTFVQLEIAFIKDIKPISVEVEQLEWEDME